MTTSPVDADLAEQLRATALALADAARVATLRWFRSAELAADNKDAAGFDPVTEADRAAERAMRELLAARRPDDAILGEEFGSREGTTGLTWILDPVDGTRAFLAGAPTWGVLIAVADDTGPLLGVIDQPFVRERFVGDRLAGEVVQAWTEGPMGSRPLATRAPRPLEQAVLMTTYPEVGTEEERRAFRRVAERARLTRYGLDCYAYALLAHGQVDLVIEAGLQTYDIAAPIAVIEAAGGLVTDWQGGPALGGGQVVAAANPVVHAAALERLTARE